MGWKVISEKKRTRCSSQQFREDDLDGVEPVQRLWDRTAADLISIPLAIVPQADLVEIMQANCPSNRVDQLGLRYGLRDDVAEVELDEVDGAGDVTVVGGDVADFDEDSEDEGDQKEK